jgi:hypothetical protein
VLYAADTDDVVRSVELYQGISGEADRFNTVISMLLWRLK